MDHQVHSFADKVKVVFPELLKNKIIQRLNTEIMGYGQFSQF